MPGTASQTITGKAFEYSLLNEIYVLLDCKTKVSILENEPYRTARKCFESFSKFEQKAYKLASNTAVKFLLDIEPRLSNSFSDKDTLELEIVSDKRGQSGDVRDVLAIRSLQKWEIGISAKNNHRAVKHSRLSSKIDFGSKWLNIPCSSTYFEEIRPIFNMLTSLKTADRSTKWDSIENMHHVVYIPILDAFKKELERLDKENPDIVAARLVEYLIGNKDFYKVIKSGNQVEIYAYNLHGSLTSAFESLKPRMKATRLKLPNRLIEIVYEKNSTTTLIVTLNEGWQISFRIHNASSRVEPSLKFDINLISTPHTLFTQHLNIDQD